MTTIRNGLLVRGDTLVSDDIHFHGERIVAGPVDDEFIDASDLIVSPGLIDIQINGGFGKDFTQDPTTIWEVGAQLPRLGVTSFVPTVVTSPQEVTDLAIEVVSHRRPGDYEGADVLGLHFEGPWISPDMHGAHNASHIVDPDMATARRWIDSGVVRIVTLAPERPGARDVLDLLAGAGVVVSLGHTAASFEVASGAFDAGATLATHLYNQMSRLDHRDPGTVGAVFLSDCYALLIVDGLHVADAALEIAWRLLGPDRVILVTDAMAALGLGPGTYPLGDGPITVGDDGPRTVDGRLAGSVVTLPRAMANLEASAGASPALSFATTTSNPARALGLGDRGSLQVGSRADITLLTRDMDPVTTIVAGKTVYVR